MRKSYLGLTAVAVAAGILVWSTSIQARPDNPRAERRAGLTEISRDIHGVYGSTYAGPTVDSTGFEVSDGWNLGFICDTATFTNCLGPPLPAGCTGDPMADGNCCIDDPNPNTGWYLSVSSEHCNEPHIDTANPATGEQHLRFSRDPAGGNPAGCLGHGTACRISAFTPATPAPMPIGQTDFTMSVAMEAPVRLDSGSSLQMFTVSDNHTNNYNAIWYFDNYGIWYIYDFGYQGYVGAVYMSGSGAYDILSTVIDPCNGTVTYFHNGAPVWAQSAGMNGVAEWIERAIFQSDNDDNDWDVDDWDIFRHEPCPTECGNDVNEPGEQCDGTDDADCPGKCVAPGETGPNGEAECMCIIDEGIDCDDATEVFNGINGPFLTHGGYFKYMADAPATSLHTCDADFDTEIYWGFDAECLTYTAYNDECIDIIFGADFEVVGDPTAPCYTTVYPPYPGSSCMCVETVPGTEYVFVVAQYYALVPPGVGNTINVEFVKKTSCYEPIPEGACCDGNTGECIDNVPVEQCVGDQMEWFDNKLCSMIECLRHTGACCDGTNGVCVNDLYPEDCTGDQQEWFKGLTCLDIVCEEHTGACCDNLTGSCMDDTLQGDCLGGPYAQPEWFKMTLCGEIQCVPAMGACCDHDDGSCTQMTQAACLALPKGEWFKATDCAAIECVANFIPIPTVSEWGLAILALLLLVGAKVYFGRRQAATT